MSLADPDVAWYTSQFVNVFHQEMNNIEKDIFIFGNYNEIVNIGTFKAFLIPETMSCIYK